MASFAHAHNTDDNLERTLDEVEALRSILGEENITCNMNTDGVNLCIKVISPSTQFHETNDDGDNDTTTTTPLPPPPTSPNGTKVIQYAHKQDMHMQQFGL